MNSRTSTLKEDLPEKPFPFWLRISLEVVQPVLVIAGLMATIIMQVRQEGNQKALDRITHLQTARQDSLNDVAQKRGTMISMMDLLVDPDPGKRNKAIKLAEAILSDHNLTAGFLGAAYALESDPSNKRQAIEELEKLGSASSVRVINHLLHQPLAPTEHARLKEVHKRVIDRSFHENLKTAKELINLGHWQQAAENLKAVAPLLARMDSSKVLVGDMYFSRDNFEESAKSYYAAFAGKN